MRRAQIAPSDFSSGEADFPQETFVDFEGTRRSMTDKIPASCVDHFGIGSKKHIGAMQLHLSSENGVHSSELLTGFMTHYRTRRKAQYTP